MRRLMHKWAYAGVAFFYLTSIVAHYVHGDHWALHLVNVFLLALLLVSNFTLVR